MEAPTPATMQNLVPGVFGSRPQAEAAIAELRAHGFSDADLGVAVPVAGRYEIPDEETGASTWSGFARGVAIGAPIGTLAGIGLLALAVPPALVGVGGVLATLKLGTLWGAALGGGMGLFTKVRWNPEEDRWCEIPIGGEDVLVVVRTEERRDEARRILERHGARCFLDEARRVETTPTDRGREG